MTANSPVSGDAYNAMVARLTALELKVDNMGRRVPNSLVVGDLGDGDYKFSTDPDQTAIRDEAGDVIIADDNVTGWGLTQPNLEVPFIQFNSDAATQNNVRDGVFRINYYIGHIINHPKLSFGASVQISNPGGGATLGWRTCWYPSIPLSSPTVMGTATGLTGGAGAGYLENATYTWPTNMFGQLIYLTYESSISGGASGDWVSAAPSYFYCHGD